MTQTTPGEIRAVRQSRTTFMACLPQAALALATVSLGAAHATDVPSAQRILAAQVTADSAADCVAAQPFYWEIGDKERLLAGGQAGNNAPTRNTTMSIASASKWIYASYVAERRNGELTPDDIHFLNFESGYTRFRVCTSSQTVQSCQESVINGFGKIDLSTVDKFDYNGGHMQKHAMLMGLGSLGNTGLGIAIRQGLRPLGSDWFFAYVQPQLAGGGSTTANDYARFLRGILDGDLQMSKLLGFHPVCTNPATCATAVYAPIPETESWHYGIGHWVEDDPKVGDHAYSSPGAFGFYPWIDANKQYYGVLAREVHAGVLGKNAAAKPAMGSVQCGRLIRAAWEDGQARP